LSNSSAIATTAGPGSPSAPSERFVPSLLAPLTSLFSSVAAVAFTVDDTGLAGVSTTYCTPGHDGARTAALVARLGQLEAIDPFSHRRAAACRATVMSVADVGGAEAYPLSIHGQHLERLGYGAPVVLYLWRAGRIEAGVALLRERTAPPFEPPAVRMLRLLHPLLEHAFALGHERHAQELDLGALAAALTVREAEIARLVAAGASNAEIAGTLRLSEGTVKTHLTKIYVKLGVRSRTQLAVTMGTLA
jgi:DNA-binding CsgD family transcriptional regulator